jgi:hypothetical protein
VQKSLSPLADEPEALAPNRQLADHEPGLPRTADMKQKLHMALAIAAMAAAVGCSDDSAPEAEPVLERERAALERARGVEDQLQEAADRQRERIDDEGG